MLIHESVFADKSEITMLVNKAYRGESSKKGWTTEAHLLSGNRIDEETVGQYLNDPRITILKCTDFTDRIIGCVYLERKDSKLYLGMLSVDPEQQAGGIGRKLLEAADKFAREHLIQLIFITVISTRTELIAWYKRRGYTANGKEYPLQIDPRFGIPNNPIMLIEMEKRAES